MQKTATSIKHERLKTMPLRPVSGFRLPKWTNHSPGTRRRGIALADSRSQSLVDFLSVFKGKKGMVRIFEAERSRSRIGVDCGDGARHCRGFDRSTFDRCASAVGLQKQQSHDQSLTCRTDAVIGDNSCFRMKPFVLLLGYVMLTGAVMAQSPSSPVITIRKGTAVVVALKDASGPAAAVLKNDIELSGVLTLGDKASATVLTSVTGSSNGVSAQAVDKTGSVVLQKNY